MSQEIAIYLRQTSLGDTYWHDVTEYLSSSSVIEIRNTLDNERLDLSLTLVEPKTATGDLIIVDEGDDIVICEDSTRTNVLADSVGGWIYYIKDTDYTFDDDTFVEYQIKAKHRDYSKLEIEIDIGTVIKFYDLLAKIFKPENVKNFLGGIMPSGQVIPNYTIEYQNVDVPGFKSKGIISELFSQIIKNLGLHSKVILKCEPDPVNNLKLIYSIRVFDGTGDSQITADWQQGINQKILIDGEIPSPFFIDEITTPNQPKTIWCEGKFGIEKDASAVKNDIRLDAYVIDKLGKVTFKKIKQKDDTNILFNLDSPALDILYVARYISDTNGNNTIVIESVASTTVFNIDLSSANLIAYDKARLDNNALGSRLVCRVKVGAIYYIRKFNIVGQTITLDTVSETELDVIGLSTTSEFELVNGYDQLKANRPSYPGDENGYTIKNIKFGENASITFTSYDKPLENEYVIIGYYKLSAFRSPIVYQNSRDTFDLGVVREQIPYPVTLDQYNLILDQYIKMIKPLITVSFLSYRLNFCQVGWNIPITLRKRRQIVGNYLISEVTHRLISSESPYYKKGLWESEYIARSYRDGLGDLLAKFQNNYNVTETLLEETQVIRNPPITIELVHMHYEGTLIEDYLEKPVFTAATNISSSSFTLNWIFVQNASSYVIEIYLNAGLTTSLFGYTGGVFIGNVNSFIVNASSVATETGPFYCRIRAVNNSTASIWSNTLSVSKNSQYRDLSINSNTLVYSHHRDSAILNVPNVTANGASQGLTGVQTGFTTGIIAGDDTCVTLDGVSNYISYPPISFNSSTFTATIAFQFISLKNNQILVCNYNGIGNAQMYIEYNNVSKKFRLLIYGTNGYLGMSNDNNINFNLNESNIIEMSWDQLNRVFKFYLNGISQAVSQSEGTTDLSNILVINNLTNAFNVGAFIDYAGVNHGLPYFPNIKVLRTKYTNEATSNIQALANYNVLFPFSNDFIFPSGVVPSLLYDSSSMIGSGALINDSANNNDGTLSNSTSWATSAKWGHGVNLETVNTSIAHNNNFKSQGVNAKFVIAFVMRISDIVVNKLTGIYITQNPPYTETNIYYNADSTGKIAFFINLHDNSQFSQPSLLGFKTDFLNINLNQDFGIAFFIDLATNSMKCLINQDELSFKINTESFYFYNSINDFKSNGSLINSGAVVNLNPVNDFPTGNAKAFLFRMFIATESNSPTVAQVKTMFQNMGLT